jgi:hypothetical protein
MMKVSPRKLFVGLAASIGAAVGAYAFTNALSSDSNGAGTGRLENYASVSTLLPAVDGTELPIFAPAVSAMPTTSGIRSAPVVSGTGQSVTFQAGATSDQICFTIELAMGPSDGCVQRAVVQTGVLYNAFQQHGGPIEIIGIVPDEVASVSINGTTIEVHSNVWFYTGSQGDDLSFTVFSADKSKSAAVK